MAHEGVSKQCQVTNLESLYQIKLSKNGGLSSLGGKKSKINEERKKAQDTTKKLNVSDIRH